MGEERGARLSEQLCEDCRKEPCLQGGERELEGKDDVVNPVGLSGRHWDQKGGGHEEDSGQARFRRRV